MRYLYSICFLLFSSLLWGQSNPFEVVPPVTPFSAEKSIIEDTIIKTVDTDNTISLEDSMSSYKKDKDTSNNIFDIGHTPNVNNHTSDIKNQKNNASHENPFEITKEVAQKESKPEVTSVADDRISDKTSIDYLNEERSTDHFLFWLNLLSIVLIALITTRYNQTIKKVVNGVTNENVLSLNQRNEHNGLSLPYILLYIVSIIELTIFIYLLINEYLSIYGISIFMKLFAIITLVIIIKHLLIWSVGKIFNIDNLTNFYNFRIQSYNILLGILLIPITLLMHYSPNIIASISMYIGLLFIASFAILLYSRAILSSLNILKVNILHFLLYLCTFEIIPMLILVKFVLNLNH